MPKLVLDQAALDRLRAGAVAVEVIDPAGNSKGLFYLQPRNPLWDLFPYTSEQFEQMENEPGGKTTEEMIRLLEKRT